MRSSLRLLCASFAAVLAAECTGCTGDLEDLGAVENAPPTEVAPELWSYLIHVPPAPNDPTANYQFVNCVAVDSQDRLIVAGRGVPSIDLGATPSGDGYLYLTQFDSDGSPLWARRFGTGAFAEIRSLATDADDNIFISGEFRGDVQHESHLDVGTGELDWTGGTDIFIASFDRAGTVRWALRRGGASYDTAGPVAIDAQGRALAAFVVDGHLTILRITREGAVDLEHAIPGTIGLNGALCPAAVIAADEAGDIYVAGRAAPGTDFGGGARSRSGFEVGWLVSFSGVSGAYRWERILSTDSGNPVVGSGLDVTGMAIDGEVVILTGGFPGAVDFGAGPIDSGSEFNPDTAFVARYRASDGAYRAAWPFGQESYISGLTRDRRGRSVLTARWSGAVQLGDATIEGDGRPAVLVLGPGGEVVAQRALVELAPPEPTSGASPSITPVVLDGTDHPFFAISYLRKDVVSFTTLSDFGVWDALLVHLAP